MLAILVISACLINEALYQQRLAELSDHDGDGYASEDDCDDGDEGVHPGAPEQCNTRDDDCDGVADDDPADPGTWLPDADADGYGAGVGAVQACDAPDGHVAQGGDCDDSRSETHPDAVDEPYDGIDQDCLAGDLRDVDADGVDASAVGGADCDDRDGTVFPGAVETCFDTVDQDCDGADLQDCDLDGHLPPEAGGDDCDDGDEGVHAGAAELWQDAGVDNDCDGTIDDVIEQSLRFADVIIDPPATSGYTARVVGTLPDLDGDGLAEVWMTAPYESARVAKGGALYVLSSQEFVPGTVRVEDVGWSIEGTTPNGLFGSGVALGAIGSYDALVVGEPGAESGAGALWGVDLSALGSASVVRVEDVGTLVLSGAPGDFLGINALSGTDFDGDGVDDLLVDALGSGLVYGLSGPGWSSHAAEDADWVFSPPDPATWLSPTAAGDVDEDGVEDFALTVHEPSADETGVFILPGGASLASGAADASPILTFLGGTTVRPIVELGSGERVLVAMQWQASAFVEPEVGASLDRGL